MVGSSFRNVIKGGGKQMLFACTYFFDESRWNTLPNII